MTACTTALRTLCGPGDTAALSSTGEAVGFTGSAPHPVTSAISSGASLNSRGPAMNPAVIGR
jgi:hypothetical protein